MVKVKGKDIIKFLNAWDKKAYDLNVELKKMHQKQKKEQVILQKKEGFTFRVQ
jgi:hypothetical protein